MATLSLYGLEAIGRVKGKGKPETRAVRGAPATPARGHEGRLFQRLMGEGFTRDHLDPLYQYDNLP